MDPVLPEDSQLTGFKGGGRGCREGGVGIGWEYGDWFGGVVGRFDDSIDRLIYAFYIIIIPTYQLQTTITPSPPT